MQGQWLGRFDGDSRGRIMVNIDAVDGRYEGVVHVSPDVSGEAPSVVLFATQNLDARQSVETMVVPIDLGDYAPKPWRQLAARYPKQQTHSESVQLELKAAGDHLTIAAVTNLGVRLGSELERAVASSTSKIKGLALTWTKFKTTVTERYESGFLFRGQRQPWSLCTAFHRRRRFRMHTFSSSDVRQLHQRLSAITPHYFDLSVPDQNGAFANLLQHHGYPTPLLDWSHSPYVAAFFAFRYLPIAYLGDDVVRVYDFNAKAWAHNYNQIQHLDPPFPHLSVMEFLAIANPRIVPQQSVTTITNIHDIEAYVLECERGTRQKFLEAIDMRADERAKAMRELRVMGITAGSMFPGIEGVCEDLVERNFEC